MGWLDVSEAILFMVHVTFEHSSTVRSSYSWEVVCLGVFHAIHVL